MEFVLAGFVMTFGVIGFTALGFLGGVLLMQHAQEMKEEMESDEFQVTPEALRNIVSVKN